MLKSTLDDVVSLLKTKMRNESSVRHFMNRIEWMIAHDIVGRAYNTHNNYGASDCANPPAVIARNIEALFVEHKYVFDMARERNIDFGFILGCIVGAARDRGEGERKYVVRYGVGNENSKLMPKPLFMLTRHEAEWAANDWIGFSDSVGGWADVLEWKE